MNNKIIIILCFFIIICLVTSHNTNVPIEKPSIQVTPHFPPIRLFENVLSNKECDAVIAYGENRMQKKCCWS